MEQHEIDSFGAEIARRNAAREAAIADGHDPDEVVSYGPPTGDGVEREAPIWMSYCDVAKKRLP
ncbi:MAG: hypothetical protein ACMVO3_22560 [Thalassobaculum sp.]